MPFCQVGRADGRPVENFPIKRSRQEISLPMICLTKYGAFGMYRLDDMWAVNSGGECYLHTVEATGSNPVPPTSFFDLGDLENS